MVIITKIFHVYKCVAYEFDSGLSFLRFFSHQWFPMTSGFSVRLLKYLKGFQLLSSRLFCLFLRVVFRDVHVLIFFFGQ